MATFWSFKNEVAPGVDELRIDGEIVDDEEAWLYEWFELPHTSPNMLRNELNARKGRAINVWINSYGGSVFEGTAIYTQLRRHPAHKTVYVDGFACSIASVIAMAGDEVVMPRNALMMVHNMWMCVQGNAAELRKAADDLDKINEAGREAYLQKAGDKLTPEMIAQMEDDETWLTAEECIQYGLADRYAEQEADMSQAAAVLQKANLNLEQRLKVQKSLAAQLRQLLQYPQRTGGVPNSEPAPAGSAPEPRQETNPILKLFGGGTTK